MIVGQSPGKAELRLRKPFVGPSGELVGFLLDEVQLDRDQVYITNVVKCQPPGNRPSLLSEISNCYRTWLHHELRLVAPKVVLLLGKDAHSAVVPSHVAPFKHRNVTARTMKNGDQRFYISCYHPSYCMRANIIDEFVSVGSLVREHLEK